MDAHQGFDDTDNADQITESGNKNVVNLDAIQGCADTDTADQVATMDKKRTNVDTIKSTKSEADILKNDEDHRLQINSIVRMNGINSPAQIFYQDLFATDDGGDHKVDICDDDAIDIILLSSSPSFLLHRWPYSTKPKASHRASRSCIVWI